VGLFFSRCRNTSAGKTLRRDISPYVVVAPRCFCCAGECSLFNSPHGNHRQWLFRSSRILLTTLLLHDYPRVIRPQRSAFDGCAGTVYTIQPSCFRALDGDQSRGFGASAVTRVGDWLGAPEFFSLSSLTDPGGLFIRFDHSERLDQQAPLCP
jgi:hypothetical protein